MKQEPGNIEYHNTIADNLIYSMSLYKRIRDERDEYFGEDDMFILLQLGKQKTPFSFFQIKQTIVKANRFSCGDQITKVLKRLQKLGYIINNPTPRRSNYKVTLAGKRLLAQINEEVGEVYKRAIERREQKTA